MGTCIETIFSCTRSNEVLCVLEAFLREFAESGLVSHIPPDLRPVRACSPVEVKSWSKAVRIALQQHANGSNLEHDTLSLLGGVLSAASRRIEVLERNEHIALSEHPPSTDCFSDVSRQG